MVSFGHNLDDNKSSIEELLTLPFDLPFNFGKALAANFFFNDYISKENVPKTIVSLDPDTLFSKEKFEEFDNLLSWDEERFNRLYKEGWIEVFRNRKKTRKSLYCISFKTDRVIGGIYKKLSGQEIPTSLSGNPMFAKNVKYSDKIYRNMILEMNAAIRQQRRLSLE